MSRSNSRRLFESTPSSNVKLLWSLSSRVNRYSPRNEKPLPGQPSLVSIPAPTNQPSRSLSIEKLRSVPLNTKERSASVETRVQPVDMNKSVLGLERMPSLPPIDHACPS